MFLYKLKDGACPKSFGLDVARKAGIPDIIISSARKIAETMKLVEHGTRIGQARYSCIQRLF